MNEKLLNKYKSILETITSENKKNAQYSTLSGFAPLRGNKYNGKLMIVGKATNGWGKFNIKDIGCQENILKVINKIESASISNNGSCPLKFVIDNWTIPNKDNYHFSRSAFWRVVKKLLKKMEISNSDTDWVSYLIWDELYKISFESGNPDKYHLDSIQLDNCIEILKEEINIYMPENIVFLTGLDWFNEFSDRIGDKTNISEHPNDLAQLSFILNNKHKVVVARHPQCKPEDKWTSEVFNELSRLNLEI